MQVENLDCSDKIRDFEARNGMEREDRRFNRVTAPGGCSGPSLPPGPSLPEPEELLPPERAEELVRLAAALDLPHAVAAATGRLFLLASALEALAGRPGDAVLAACLYIAARYLLLSPSPSSLTPPPANSSTRQGGRPQAFRDLSGAVGGGRRGRKEVLSCFRLVLRALEEGTVPT
jgi:hypothetical protein